MYSSELQLMHNRIIGNRGPSGFGIGLKDMDTTHLADNIIAGNRVGLYLDSAEARYERNHIVLNDTGARVLPSSQHNVFEANSFIENGEQIVIEGLATLTANRWNSNFWSDYQGYDADGDGVGDLPYQAVQLFETLVARYPALRLYAESPAVRALEFAAS